VDEELDVQVMPPIRATAEPDAVAGQLQRHGIDGQADDPRLFAGLSQGGFGEGRIIRLTVAAGLQPLVCFAVKDEQRLVVANDQGAGSEVIGRATAEMGVGVGGQVVEIEPPQVVLLNSGRGPRRKDGTRFGMPRR